MQIVNIRYAKELKYIDNKVVINFNKKTSNHEVSKNVKYAVERAMRRNG